MKRAQSIPKDPVNDATAAPDTVEPSDERVEGEGSYTATRDYNERTRRFVDAGGVEEAAGDAAPDSDAEAAELRKAEEAGKARARK